ncbi:hypothetical protein ACH4SP_09010 [Streptomyces sp. NPDC021093]|uniref:hypothetical protein n=1 Tax=Streptomyces sp. NPDC021093 TaxID=3365112 RepID=UPI0037939C30
MTTATESPSSDSPTPDSPASDAVGEASSAEPRPRLLAVGAALLLAAAAGYGIYALTGPSAPTKPPVPTAAVTYEITGTGTADITYLATSEQGTATTEKAATLPWKKTVQVPLGKSPVVKVQLPQQGGTATCALAIRDQHQQRATASGAYGRTTCTAPLPAEGR